MKDMVQNINRRRFLAVSLATLAAPSVGRVLGANGKINVACIGVGGKGNGDTDHAAQCGGNIVALCDVDENNLNRKAKKFPEAKLYRDYRKMFEAMDKSIDAVVVSAPDHHHGVACGLALQLGKPVYCQKPLVQSFAEAGRLRELAAQKKVATQMGNQGSANNSLRRAVEVVQGGVIGAVREAHVWSSRPMWPSGIARPAGQDPVPGSLDWDLWIGPAPMRPFKAGVYHPSRWRGWCDFGTGAIGDMGCHTLNMPFRALNLGAPSVLECELASNLTAESYPRSARLRFEFPQRGSMPPLKLWWYDGNPNDKSFQPVRPVPDLVKDILEPFETLAPNGILLVGDKGRLYSPDEGGGRFYIKLRDDKEYLSGLNHPAAKEVPVFVPRAPEGVETKRPNEETPRNVTQLIDFRYGEDLWQKEEWFRGIRDGSPTYSNFDFAARLTECLLLGCVALRTGPGRRIEWDPASGQSSNCAEANAFLKRQNRAGWES